MIRKRLQRRSAAGSAAGGLFSLRQVFYTRSLLGWLETRLAQFTSKNINMFMLGVGCLCAPLNNFKPKKLEPDSVALHLFEACSRDGRLLCEELRLSDWHVGLRNYGNWPWSCLNLRTKSVVTSVRTAVSDIFGLGFGLAEPEKTTEFEERSEGDGESLLDIIALSDLDFKRLRLQRAVDAIAKHAVDPRKHN